MHTKKLIRSYFLFGLLFLYITVQFIWWGSLLYNQAKQLDQAKFPFRGENLKATQWMLIGEGGVFLIILIVILTLAFRSISKELRLALRQKNFLLSVSHELKTPLTTSRTVIETLLKRDLPGEKKDMLLQTLLNENKRFSDLVNNVFLAQRLDNGSFTVRKNHQDLSNFIAANLQKWQQISAPGNKVISTLEPDIYLEFDPAAIETVFHNLISNAAKYSPPQSEIKVQLEKNNSGEIKVRVIDQGIGIAKKELKNIFRLFYRLENEETRKTKGTGLGLYICKNIVEEHNGKIVAKTTDAGSTFEITFK